MKNPTCLFFRFLLLFVASALMTQANDKPPVAGPATYILVHGAWGGGWAFREIDQRLSSLGHKVFRPTLTGLGEKVHLARPDINLTTHINDVTNLILWEDLHEVILVGHSYGGAVITGVLDRVPDRIKHVIYLDAAILNHGESMLDARNQPAPPRSTGDYIIPPWVHTGQPLPHDVPHPVKSFTEKIVLKNQERAKTIPATYALFVEPGTDPENASFYQHYLRAKQRGWHLRILGSDHNAQWSHPQELTSLLDEAPVAPSAITP